jgi:hypothetical protein
MTRTHRTPWSIWIIAVLWSLAGLVPLARLGASNQPGDRMIVSSVALLSLALAAYKAIALIRLSRWPVVLGFGSVAWSVTERNLANFDWRQHYPMLGIFAFLFPTIVLLACTLPHWRKMNWALFGRPYRPAEDQVEVFS